MTWQVAQLIPLPEWKPTAGVWPGHMAKTRVVMQANRIWIRNFKIFLTWLFPGN